MTNARKRLLRSRKQSNAIARVLTMLHTRAAPTRARKTRKEPSR